MAKHLIIGGAGFIGRHLGVELLHAGHEVRVLDSLVDQVHWLRRDSGLADEIEFLRGDVRDGDTVASALEGVDGVFHLAAEVGVGQSMYEIERYVSANDVGTAVLLQQLINRPVRRIVVASSMSVYGEGLYETTDGTRCEGVRRSTGQLREGDWDPRDDAGNPLTPIPTDEGKRPDLASVYALSKYVQEQMTLMLGAAYGIEAVALRLFNVFGPGQALSNPYTGVLAIFAGRLLNGQPPMVFEDGQQRRDFVHVKDVARAFRLAMEAPEAPGEIVNVGSGHSISINEIARQLTAAMGREDLAPQVLGKWRAGDIRHCFADIGKARRILGFQPELTLANSLDDFILWLADQQAEDRVGQAHKELEERGLVV